MLLQSITLPSSDFTDYAWPADELARFEAYMSGAEPPVEPTDPQAPSMGHNGGIGHNSGALPTAKAPESATVFEQFEAIVDSPIFTAEQKCILVKVRCRVDGKTKGNAIASNEGLMRAASLKDPRALRAELRDLQGKTRDLPEERDKRGRPIYDPIDDSRATIVLEERPGKASVIGFRPERLQAIVAAYWQHREQKRGPGKPPASYSGGLTSTKPPASGRGGLAKPPASHAQNPLRQTHPDPFPLSGRKKEGAEPPPPRSGASAPNGKAAMATALGGQAAYAVRNVIVGDSGKITLGEEFRKELREAYTDSQIDRAIDRAPSSVPSLDPLKLLAHIRRACSYAKQDDLATDKKLAAFGKGQSPRKTFQR